MDGWMDRRFGRVYGWMDGWISGCMDMRLNEWMGVWMDGRVDGGVGAWVDVCMDGWIISLLKQQNSMKSSHLDKKKSIKQVQFNPEEQT